MATSTPIKCEERASRRFTGVLDIARRVGRSSTTISLILRNKREPGPELRKKLEALGVEIPAKGAQ